MASNVCGPAQVITGRHRPRRLFNLEHLCPRTSARPTSRAGRAVLVGVLNTMPGGSSRASAAVRKPRRSGAIIT
jgi:hypothetical protein